MPPKAKAAASPAAAGEKRKRLDTEDDTTSSGRPKRSSVGKPQYRDKRQRRPAHNEIKADPSTVSDPPRKRGRPRKDSKVTPAKSDSAPATAKSSKVTKSPKSFSVAEPPLARKRGRPSLKAKATESESSKKSQAKTTVKGTNTPQKRGRGRPRKTNGEVHQSSPDHQTLKDSGTDSSDDEGPDEDGNGEQYWLMKAEPNDRFEKGHNVKFSIDDLAAASEPEPWDGVRNYVARNNMRAMRKGDLAFFYHSNCAIPGIVGVMRIAIEHDVDKSALDPNHPYFDPKSDPENPKWDCVHVEFIKKFDQQITLKMLGDNATSTGELANMQVLKQKRLSVTAVKPKEWRYVLEMAGENVNLGKQTEDGDEEDGDQFDSTDNDIEHIHKSDTIEGEVNENPDQGEAQAENEDDYK